MPEAEAKKRSLLDITDDMLALDDLLAEIGGDLTDPRVELAITEWESELASDLDGKVDGYCRLIRSRELQEAAIREEAERLMAKAGTMAKQTKWLKDRLKMALTVLGQKKAGRTYTASVVANGGQLPLVLDPALDGERPSADGLPAEFVRARTTYRLDTDRVRSHLELGGSLPFARIGERGTHLRIK